MSDHPPAAPIPPGALLAGRTAIITGAGSGVGRASALRFAAQGAKVVCADVLPDRLEETVRQVEASGGTAVAQKCDVSVEADVADLVASAVDRFGRLDIMFNNVGIPTPSPGLAFEDHTADEFDRLVAVNLRGVFLGCKYAIIRFKQQGSGGVILNTGSVAGMVGFGGVPYGATKGGVHALTRGIAIECAPFGIRANAICPAAMLTNFMGAGGNPLTEEDLPRLAAYHPLNRPIAPEDCADAALYLVSDLSANVTGTLLPIDGGYTAR